MSASSSWGRGTVCLLKPLLKSGVDTVWLHGHYGDSRAVFKQLPGAGPSPVQNMSFNDSLDRAVLK